jgi:hypothetical protein
VSNHKRFIAIISSAIIFAACNVISENISSIPSASVNASTITTTPESIRTSSLTSTATPNFRSSPTIPPETLVALATMDALVTNEPDLAKYYSWDCMIYACYSTGLGLSPNGNWAVFYNGEEYGGLSIVEVEGTKRWDINYFDIASCPCGPSTGVYVEHWSQDGKYFYASPQDGSEGGLEDFWRSKTELWRLDLEIGDIINANMGPAFSFSPDDSSIVYRNGQEIVIHEFQTGQAVKFNVPYKYKSFGRFVWSPDQKNIAFIVSDDLSFNFSLLILNLEQMNAKLILDEDERSLYPAAWQTEEIILLQGLFDVNYDYADLRDGGYQLNLQTNEITEWILP